MEKRFTSKPIWIPSTCYVLIDKTIYMYIYSHDLLISHVTCLNNTYKLFYESLHNKLKKNLVFYLFIYLLLICVFTVWELFEYLTIVSGVQSPISYTLYNHSDESFESYPSID